MGKARNLSSQANYVVSQSLRIGHQRRAEERNGVNVRSYIYSNNTASNMRNSCNSFTKFMRSEHPEIRQLKDIKAEHVQEYLDKNLQNSNFSISTAKERLSDINKLAVMASNVFGSCRLDFSSVTLPKTVTEIKQERGKAMTEKDLQKLKEYMEERNSCAKFVPGLVSTSGLRADEISYVRPEHVRFSENGATVEVHNGKGGRYREVELNERDVPYWREVMQHAQRNNWETLTKTYNEDSVQKAVRRAMKAVGISEKYQQGVHSIRKYFAVKTFKELKQRMSEERAWDKTAEKLGHGAGRLDLKAIYTAE